MHHSNPCFTIARIHVIYRSDVFFRSIEEIGDLDEDIAFVIPLL